jgi:hypothetical protein
LSQAFFIAPGETASLQPGVAKVYPFDREAETISRSRLNDAFR